MERSEPEQRLSPEIDLVEQLSGGDLPMSIGLKVFQGDVARFRRSIAAYVEKGVVKILREPRKVETALPVWEVAALLRNESAWIDEPTDTEYWMTLTPRGIDAFWRGRWSAV
jgi:hypothetical protein